MVGRYSDLASPTPSAACRAFSHSIRVSGFVDSAMSMSSGRPYRCSGSIVAPSVATGSDGSGTSEKSCASPVGERHAAPGEGGARLTYEVAHAQESTAEAAAARYVTASPPRRRRDGFPRPGARSGPREARTTSPGDAPADRHRRLARWRVPRTEEWAGPPESRQRDRKACWRRSRWPREG